MIHFSLEEKLVIAGACAIAVIIFAIIMACKISPYCCLYRMCPFRARHDEEEDDDDETGKGKSQGKTKGNYKYHLVNYANQAPPVPSVTLTSLEKSSSGACAAAAMTFTGPNGAALPAYTAIPNAGNVPCKLQHVRSHKTSTTSSASGSSTISSDSGITSTNHPNASGSSGVGTLSSSDGGETPIPQPPTLDLSMRYNEEEERLSIHVRSALRVPLNIYGGANDSYLQILVVKDLKRRWRRRSDIPLDELLQIITANASKSPDTVGGRGGAGATYGNNLPHQGQYELAEFKTQLIRRKVDPVFNEQFTIEVKRKDKKYTCVKFILRSIDRFSHHSIVGTCHLGLANFGNGQEVAGMDEFSIALQPYMPDLGEMMLSLCYLPTAERLHVNVMKITNLKSPAGLSTANPYIKAVIVRRGKVLEKHSTSVQFHTLNPIFNEALVFDVPATELEKITLLITVVHQDSSDVAELPMFEDRSNWERSVGSTGSGGHGTSGRRSSSANGLGARRRSLGNVFDDAQGSSEDACAPLQKSRSIHSIRTKPYLPLGRLAFGSLAAVKGASRHHWQEMLKSPRKHVAQWHKLQP